MNQGIDRLASPFWRYVLAVFLIVMAASLIYSNTLHAPFVFDDQTSIKENAKIRDLHNFETINVLKSPRPLVDFTFALNYHFGKLRVFGYHLINLMIHIANGILVYLLARSVFKKLSSRSDSDNFIISSLTALIFIAHPIQTESVTYIAQRYVLMAAFFYISAVLTYIRARDAKNAGKTLLALGNSIVFIICGVMAFLCKQNAASLPLMILLLEYAIFDQTWDGWKKKLGYIIPGVLLFGCFYAYNMGVFSHNATIGSLLEDVSDKSRDTQMVSRWQYLCTQFNVIVIYIRLLFFPIRQNLDYVYPFKNGFFDDATPYAFLFLIGTLGIAWFNRKKHSVLFFGILWFFIALSVESSIFPIRDALFEHRLYLPMIGFTLIVSHYVYKLFDYNRIAGYGLIFMMTACLSIATYNRNTVWRDEIRLWSDVVDKNPSNYRGMTNLANALMNSGYYKDAMAWYDQVLKKRPDNFLALYNMGVLFDRIGKREQAVDFLHKALRVKPDYSNALINLGVMAARSGKNDEAIEYLNKAARIQPDSIEAHYNLATAYVNSERLNEAIDQYKMLISLSPDNVNIYKKLGIILHVSDKYEEAITYFKKAIELESNDADTYLKLGNSQVSSNLLDEAVESYKKSIRLNPGYFEAHMNLGGVYFRQKNYAESISQFNEAIKINPNSSESHVNLGNALYVQGNAVEALQQFGIALRLKPDSKEILDNMNKLFHHVKKIE